MSRIELDELQVVLFVLNTKTIFFILKLINIKWPWVRFSQIYGIGWDGVRKKYKALQNQLYWQCDKLVFIHLIGYAILGTHHPGCGIRVHVTSISECDRRELELRSHYMPHKSPRRMLQFLALFHKPKSNHVHTIPPYINFTTSSVRHYVAQSHVMHLIFLSIYMYITFFSQFELYILLTSIS